MEGIAAKFALDWPGFALDVELALPARGVSALFGPSGSGKTTVLRCLAGLERARGAMRVGNEVWQDQARFLPTHRRPIGYVFQDAALFPHLSVLGNLRYGQRRSRDASSVDLKQAIELLGIGDLLDRKPDTLSGGERQRVAIARALAVGPRLLLLDEPLAALDAARKREVLPYLETLHESLDIPVVYVSHSSDEVARLADHLVLLDAGRVRAQGPLLQLAADLEIARCFGEQPGVVIDAQLAERDTQWQL
ncbi:MAG TPA: molybdenum ABC transporter ATP-binding protein, partial [Arenimonas sp.]|nr:molybdenum ABC transporter ATP-binding protein [Arenimonas sp.]